jgi:hypothetical protein
MNIYFILFFDFEILLFQDLTVCSFCITFLYTQTYHIFCHLGTGHIKMMKTHPFVYPDQSEESYYFGQENNSALC